MVKEYYVTEEELQADFDRYIDLIDNEKAHIFIMRDGEKVAVMIPYETYNYYQSIIEGDWREEYPE